MARPEETDYLQSFRFHATVLGDNANFLASPADRVGTAVGGGQAGFQSITLPDKTFEATEYREGTYKYTKKFPGPATYGDASFMRGVTRFENAFYNWGVATEAGGEYRADVIVDHFHREDAKPGATNEGYVVAPPDRQYKFHEAFCIREKIAGDLDATSGEVSIAELDIGMEFYELLAVQETSLPLGNI